MSRAGARQNISDYYFPAPSTLLDGEDDGLAIDFTDTTNHVLPTWQQRWNQVRNNGANKLSSPHVFYTQSGTSPKHVTGSTHPLEWSPHNLAQDSSVFNSANWGNDGLTSITLNSATAPDGTVSAATITAAGGTNNLYSATQPTPATLPVAVSVYLKAGVTDWARVTCFDGLSGNSAGRYFDLTNGVVGSTFTDSGTVTLINSGIESVGSGWYRCWVTGVSTTGTSTRILFQVAEADNDNTPQAADTIFAWGAQVNRGYFPTAYIATTTAAVIGLPISYGEGLLVEPAATNLLVRSQEFATTWVDVSSGTHTVSSDSVAAPDGSVTADTVTPNASGSLAYGKSITGLTVSAVQYTASCYFKPNGHSWVEILVSTDAGYSKYASYSFNITTGALGSSRTAIWTATPAITSIGNGWYRCSVTTSAVDANSTTRVDIVQRDADGFAGPFTPNGTNGVYFWGAQFETGTVASSYVPTVAASATRATDNFITVATLAFPFSATISSMLAEFTLRELANHHQVYMIDDGTANNYMGPDFIAGTGLRGTQDGAAAPNTIIVVASPAINTVYKVAMRLATNDMHAAGNGTLGTPETTVTIGTGITTLRLGQHSPTNPTRALNGYLRKMVYVPRLWTNTELQTKTT